MSDTKTFNWSRKPSNEKISAVYIQSEDSTRYDTAITKKELENSLFVYNTVNDLEDRKHRLGSLFLASVCLIPVVAIFYNIFMSVWR